MLCLELLCNVRRAETSQGEGVACFGSMSVSRLKTNTLYLRRQGGVAPPEEHKAGDKVIEAVADAHLIG